MNITILIPTLNPGNELIEYIKELTAYGFPKILVVNDGSYPSHNQIFEQCAACPPCTVLCHETSRGKGQAIKTGMEYYLAHLSQCDGLVVCDTGGPDCLSNTVKVANLVAKHANMLILGCRDYRDPIVPKRSRFGNGLISAVLRLFYRLNVRDARTGLRGMTNDLIPRLCHIGGDGVDYEINMLLKCHEHKIPSLETPLQNVLHHKNSFYPLSPFSDSLRIYWLLFGRFIRYVLNGVSSYLIDIALYSIIVQSRILGKIPSGILIATASARAVSSFCNYLLNKQLVFRIRGSFLTTFVKYVISVVFVLLCSAGLVTLLGSLFSLDPSETILVKLVVDTFLSLISYVLQRKWVFPKKNIVRKGQGNGNRSC